MLNLDKHPYFSEFADPESGVKSYILTKKVARVHQHFYFSECSLTDDGKYLWIRCLNPPANFVHLAVVSMDPDNPFVRSFPGAGTSRGSQYSIFPGTHDAIFADDSSVYRITVEGEITKLFSLDPEFVNHRYVERMFTHASVSCDKKKIALDMQISETWYIGYGDLETGKVTILDTSGRCYNHAQFSPKDPNLFLLDQDWWRDGKSGEYMGIKNRMWLVDTWGTRFEALYPGAWYYYSGFAPAHDFWAKDGTLCWSDYAFGSYECNLETRKAIHVWQRPICHSHTTYDRKYWCGDQTPYFWKNSPCKILFYDREENKEIDIFSGLKYPIVDRGGVYHLDPHPSFTKDDKYIISTVTTADGEVTLAITPVEPLKEICKKNGKKPSGKEYKFLEEKDPQKIKKIIEERKF